VHHTIQNIILASHNLIATLFSNADVLQHPQCLLSHLKAALAQDLIDFVKDVLLFDVSDAERVVAEGDELAYDRLANSDERGLVDAVHGEY